MEPYYHITPPTRMRQYGSSNDNHLINNGKPQNLQSPSQPGQISPPQNLPLYQCAPYDGNSGQYIPPGRKPYSSSTRQSQRPLPADGSFQDHSQYPRQQYQNFKQSPKPSRSPDKAYVPATKYLPECQNIHQAFPSDDQSNLKQDRQVKKQTDPYTLEQPTITQAQSSLNGAQQRCDTPEESHVFDEELSPSLLYDEEPLPSNVEKSDPHPGDCYHVTPKPISLSPAACMEDMPERFDKEPIRRKRENQNYMQSADHSPNYIRHQTLPCGGNSWNGNRPDVPHAQTGSSRNQVYVQVAPHTKRHLLVVSEHNNGDVIHGHFYKEPTFGSGHETYKAISVVVLVCFNCPIGLIALLCASAAESDFSKGQTRSGKMKANCSLITSMAGIVVTVVVIVAVVFYIGSLPDD